MTVKRRYYTFYLLALMAAGMISCTEIIEIELDSTYRRLVVFGTITTDSIHHQVRLSTSSDYFSNMPSPRVTDAVVELEFENSSIRLLENDTIPGLYLAPDAFRGKPNTAYYLRISQVDVNEDGEAETYHAATVMPDCAQVDSLRLSYFQSPFVSGYQVLMFAQDPPTREWYSYKMWKNNDLLTDTLSKYSVQSDDFYNGTYIYGLPVGFLWDDEPREALQPGDTVTLELNSIEQAHYDFILDAQLEIMGNNPLFSGPSSNVRSNIDNGGKGIFTAYSVSRVSVILQPPR